MKRFPHSERFFISEDLIAFSDEQVKAGTFGTRVDLLIYGYAYAVANGMRPPDKLVRHSLGGGVQPVTIDEQIRVALEATLEPYCKKVGIAVPEGDKEYFDLACRVACAGVAALRKKWEGRSRAQIHQDVLAQPALKAAIDLSKGEKG